jgi:TctA family transporter
MNPTIVEQISNAASKITYSISSGLVIFGLTFQEWIGLFSFLTGACLGIATYIVNKKHKDRMYLLEIEKVSLLRKTKDE